MNAPALLRTNTAPVFPGNSMSGLPQAGIQDLRASQLTGTTQFGLGSISSLGSLSQSATQGNGMNAPTGPNGGPVQANSNIINQKADASRSLYQICVALRQRLAQVPGFDVYLPGLDNETENGEGGPVEALWNLLRSGVPLLTIYNALQPPTFLSIEGAPGDERKLAKLAVFRFVQACLEQLKIKASDCFVINDLLGNDTTGFVKVTAVVNHVLDIAESQGLLLQIQQNVQPSGPESNGSSQMTYRDHIIRELVDTERKYVQDLENLHDLKKSLEQKGVIPGDIVHQIFLNINAILDFQRRFLIRVETTNSMNPTAQRWGALFVTYEEAFNIYQPFIANQRKAAQIAGQVFEKVQAIQHPVAVDMQTLDGFLLKPMQRLVKYPLLLKDLMKKSEDPDIKADLATGIEAAERVLSKANAAVDRDLLDEAVEELVNRVDDWKNHRVEQFGRLLHHGVYTVVTGKIDQEKDVLKPYEIYLFDAILLCCKEIQPSKSKDKKDKTKSALPKVRNKNAKLQLKGRIFMTNVTEVLSFAKPGTKTPDTNGGSQYSNGNQGSYTVEIWWKGDPGVEHFTIKFSNEETMKKWAAALDMQRALNAPTPTTTTVAPDQSTPDFAWMRNVNVGSIENPYAQQAESDDDELPMLNQPGQPSLAFGTQQPSTGGVMHRNASSTSLRNRSIAGESTQSLAGMARAPPPKFPMPAPSQLVVQTQGANSPGHRGGESYFSPATDSPASSRASGINSVQFGHTSGYGFPKTGPGIPQGWEDPTLHSRYTAPAMPRAPSRDGSSPVNAYTIHGRNPRGPSLPAMASHSQQNSMSQRNRSYSTPDINVQPGQRRTSNATAVPAVPGIPAHLHGNGFDTSVPRSQSGSPMQDLPIRTNTQSPGAPRERGHQSHGSYGGKMSQFPAQPIYPRQNTPNGASSNPVPPPPLQLDNRTPVSPAQGTATPGSSLFSPFPEGGPTQLKVKIVLDKNSYVTLVVAFNITYQSMIDRIDAKLGRFTGSSINKGNLKLRYRDEDGDYVNIESDEDIQIAFMEFKEVIKEQQQYNLGNVGEIELFCVET